jgi:hypothetical protein
MRSVTRGFSSRMAKHHSKSQYGKMICGTFLLILGALPTQAIQEDLCKTIVTGLASIGDGKINEVDPKLLLHLHDHLTTLIHAPIEKASDAYQMLDVIAQLSPKLNALVTKARQGNMPILLGKKTITYRSYQQIVNRKNSYAKSIAIAETRPFPTALFEIVHEMQHFVPLDETAAPLSIDSAKQSMNEIKTILFNQGMEDEAHSIEAEIELYRSLQRLGIEFDYERIRPGVLAAYEHGGREELAKQIPKLIPPYERHYLYLAEEGAKFLKKHPDDNNNFSWETSGVMIENQEDALKIQIDPEKLLSRIKSHLSAKEAQKLDSLLTLATSHLGNILQKRETIATNPERKKSTPPPPIVTLEPKQGGSTTLLDTDGMRNQRRLLIASKFPDLVMQAKKSKDSEDQFNRLITLAEHSFGRKSADYYAEAINHIHDENIASEKLQELAKSLLQSGYPSEAEKILLDPRTFPSSSADDQTKYLKEILPFNPTKQTIDMILSKIHKSLEKLVTYQFRQMKEYYNDDAALSDRAKAAIEEFGRQHYGKIFKSEELYNLITELAKNGEIEGGDWRRREINHYFDDKVFGVPLKQSWVINTINQLADVLEKTRPDESNRLRKESLQISSVFEEASQLVLTEWIHDWEKNQSEKVHYDPAKGFADFVRQVKRHIDPIYQRGLANTNRREMWDVAYALLGHPYTFERGVKFLSTFEPDLDVAKLFLNAWENLPENYSPTQTLEFIQKWNETLVAVSSAIAPDHFAEVDVVRSKMPKQFHLPETLDDLHFGSEAHLKQALKLLQSKDSKLRQAGEDILDSSWKKNAEIWNPTEYLSDHNVMYTDEFSGGSIYQLSTFNPINFKIHAITQAAPLAPERAKEWLTHAVQLAAEVPIPTDRAEPQVMEARHRVQLALARELLRHGMISEAEKITARFLSDWAKVGAEWNQELSAFEKLSKSAQEKGGLMADYNLKKQLNAAQFWKAFYESVVRAEFAVAHAKFGDKNESKKIATELAIAIHTDVESRRGRFDVSAIAMAARILSEIRELRSEANGLFKDTIEKITMMRGDNQFKSSSSYVAESIRDSSLSDLQKDELFAELISKIEPEKSADWNQMKDDIPSFMKAADIIAKEKKFRKADSEILRITENLIDDLKLIPGDSWKNIAVIGIAKTAFTHVMDYEPDILNPKHFEQFANLSNQPAFKKALAVLFPEEAARYEQSSPQSDPLNYDQIRTGYFDRVKTDEALAKELKEANDHFDSDPARFEKALLLSSELLRQDLAEARNRLGDYQNLSSDEIQSVPTFKKVSTFFDAKNWQTDSLSPRDQLIANALLVTEGKIETDLKNRFLVELIKAPNVSLRIRKMAFEQFLRGKDIPDYLKNYYHEHIENSDDVTQTKFLETIGLLVQDWALPDTWVLMFALEGKDRKNFAKTFASFTPSRLFRDDGDINSRLEDFKGSLQGFFNRREELVKQKNAWTPSLLNNQEILLTYLHKASHYSSFREFMESVRNIYVRNLYDPVGPIDYKYTYGIDDIEHQLRIISPEFHFDASKKNNILHAMLVNKNAYRLIDAHRVMGLPPERGKINYEQLTQIAQNLQFTEDEKQNLIEFLNGDDNSHLFRIISAFGEGNLNEAQKADLDKRLTELKREYSSLTDRSYKKQESLPAVFDTTPEFVRFVIFTYFEDTPYGERTIILDEFNRNSQNLTPPQAIKRFFELTHSEKIGQFLSTRHDVIPEEYRKELEGFQEGVRANSFDEVKAEIELHLKKRLSEVFSSFNEKALKVGTIGEVYEANLKNGERVAVKVITPSKRKAIREMLDRVKKIAEAVHKNKYRFPGAYDPMSLYYELKASLGEELDFRTELENGEALRPLLPDGITIPRYYPELSGESVLVQKFAEGQHISSIGSAKVKKAFTQKLGKMLFGQILTYGIFHDDLHPGNLRVVIKPSAKNSDFTIELLDFGRVGRLTATERNFLLPLVKAIKFGTPDQIVEILSALEPKRIFNRTGLLQAVSKQREIHSKNLSAMISGILFESANMGLPVRPAYLRILKAMMTFEGTAKTLDPSFTFEKLILSSALTQLFSF